jgi:cyclohexadienyl dehydratase
MKLLVPGMAILAAVTLFTGACGSKSQSSSQSLRVCSTGDYRPFTYHDQQGWTGMDIDLAENLAKHLGVKLELVQTTWANLIADVGTKCDMAMGGISVTPERAKRALFSRPYLHDGKAAIVRCADSEKYRTLADIDRPGVRVVVNPGGTNAQFDKANLHQATVLTYPDNNTIFEQVAAGKADAMITDASEIRWESTQNPQLCGVSVDRPFSSEEKAYLIAQSNPRLVESVNDWLDGAQKDGTYARIAEKWLGQVVGP